jgi:hypothetical protein
MKNSNDPIGNRTRNLPACSAVPQPTVPQRAPSVYCGLDYYVHYSALHYVTLTRMSTRRMIIILCCVHCVGVIVVSRHVFRNRYGEISKF